MKSGKFRRTLLALMLTGFVSACASNAVTSPDAFCDLYTPVKLSDGDIDVLSLSAAKQIHDNNELFIRRCL